MGSSKADVKTSVVWYVIFCSITICVCGCPEIAVVVVVTCVVVGLVLLSVLGSVLMLPLVLVVCVVVVGDSVWFQMTSTGSLPCYHARRLLNFRQLCVFIL